MLVGGRKGFLEELASELRLGGVRQWEMWGGTFQAEGPARQRPKRGPSLEHEALTNGQ